MVAAKSISYADRAKNGRPSAGHTQAKPSPITTTANSVHSARASDANYPVLTAKSEEDGLAGIPTRAANGVAWPNDHSAASSDFTAPTTSTTLNGSDSSPSTPVTPPSVAATPLSTKLNVWTVRKELMNAVRSTAAAPPHSATSTSPNHNLPHTKAQPITTPADLHSQSSQPSVPAARSKPKRSAIPSDSGNTQSPAINQAQMTTPPIDRPSSTTPATTKKKANPKSVSTSAQSTPAESPIPPLDEASSWPAPQEAASTGTGPSVRRESHPAGSEENKQGPSSHSRESSTVGAAHGKKQHWVRMSPAELQEAADSAQPPSPHFHGSGRGKRGPDGERRPVPGRVGPGGGGRSSGRNSKRSSAAPSPTTRPNGLPSSGSATTPTLNANAVPFSSRNFPSQIYGQPGQRSHPHSPMGRSPFLSSHPQSLVNSPRMGGGYGSPRRGYPMQNTPPPNTNPYNRPSGLTSQTSALVTVSNKPRIRRKVPSKAEALSGAILELRLDDNSFRPTFGTIEPVAQGGMGLGLSVPGQGVGAASELAQAPQAALELADDAVRWDEAAREPTKAEKILRAEGKFGIGTAGAEVPASSVAQEEIAAVTEQEVPAIAVEGETTAPAEGEDRPEAKPQWSFGSVDRPTAEPSPTPSDLLVVDPSRRPPYTMPFSDSPGPNGIINGYAQYDNMGRGSPNYSNNRVSPVDGQQQVGYAEGGAVNGYGSHRGYPSGRRPGRGGPRGSYGNRGGYGPRQPMSNTNSPGGYYSSGPAVPQQPIQPPQPEYSGYSYGVYYPPPPPPMEYNPYGYSDPYAVPPPPPQSSVPPPTPGGAQAGEGSPYMVMPPYGYPVYPPPPPSMVNPMMGYYYPPPGPQGFYPPPPPMPAVGYPLDEPRASILRQVEFYLSYQNMTQDNFLRSRMDSQGWVDVEMIASFNRLRRLTSDVNLVRELMHISSMIEVSPDGQKCRMANNAWQMFVAPQMEGIPPAENQGAQPQFVSDVTNAQHAVEHVPAPPEPQEEQNAAVPSALAS